MCFFQNFPLWLWEESMGGQVKQNVASSEKQYPKIVTRRTQNKSSIQGVNWQRQNSGVML